MIKRGPVGKGLLCASFLDRSLALCDALLLVIGCDEAKETDFVTWLLASCGSTKCTPLASKGGGYDLPWSAEPGEELDEVCGPSSVAKSRGGQCLGRILRKFASNWSLEREDGLADTPQACMKELEEDKPPSRTEVVGVMLGWVASGSRGIGIGIAPRRSRSSALTMFPMSRVGVAASCCCCCNCCCNSCTCC